MRRTIFSAILIGLVLFAVLEPSRIIRGILQREPFFQSRPASFWKEELRMDGQTGRVSAKITDRFSGNAFAIPVLVECAMDSDKFVRWPALSLLISCGSHPEVILALRSALDDSDADVKLLAIVGLGRMGSEAFDATPRLIELRQVDDEAISGAANFSLWQIAPDVAAQSAPWHEFSSSEFEFTVAFPGKPEEVRESVETPFGNGKLVKFSSVFAQSHFAVATVEYPQKVADEFSVDERYDSAAKMKAEFMGGELKDFKFVDIKGIAGREIVTEVPDKVRIHERVFLLGNYAYMVVVTSSLNCQVHPDEAKHFLDSFQISRPSIIQDDLHHRAFSDQLKNP